MAEGPSIMKRIAATMVLFMAVNWPVNGGIDAANESGIPYGGWKPKGRKAEDGTVPDAYTELQGLTRGRLPETNRTERYRF